MPSTGQTWTTLGKMRSARAADGVSNKYKNVFEQCPEDSKVYEIWTEPKVCCIFVHLHARRKVHSEVHTRKAPSCFDALLLWLFKTQPVSHLSLSLPSLSECSLPTATILRSQLTLKL